MNTSAHGRSLLLEMGASENGERLALDFAVLRLRYEVAHALKRALWAEMGHADQSASAGNDSPPAGRSCAMFRLDDGEASGNHGAESTTAHEARDVGVQHAVLLEVRKMSCPGSIAIDMPPTACAIGQPDDVDINEILFRATQQKY